MGKLYDQELFTITEIARLLSVSEGTVRNLVKKGYLPEGTKLMGSHTLTRWFRLDLERCIERLKAEAMLENRENLGHKSLQDPARENKKPKGA